jgi:hypothetical protein
MMIRRRRTGRPKKLRMKSLMGSLRHFRFEEGFVEKVRYDIMNPEVHPEIKKPAEVCGAFYVTMDTSTGDYIVHHDSMSTTKKESNANGFHRGTYDPDDKVQFCHPRKHASNILWHAHPRGVPSYPSGSDVFVAMVNDCSRGLSFLDTTAQAFVEFLFTEHGFWLIHRYVRPDGRMADAIDLTDSDGEPIRMNYHEMVDVEALREHVDTLINLLESRIISHYFRTPCPDQKAVSSINEEISNNPVFHLIKDRVVLNFYRWEQVEGGLDIPLPEILINTPVRGICLAG